MSADRSSQSPDTPGNSTASDQAQNVTSTERAVLAYLRSRGFSAAEQSLLQEIEQHSDDKGKRPVSSEDFLKNISIFSQSSSKPSLNALNDSAMALQSLKEMGS